MSWNKVLFIQLNLLFICPAVFFTFLMLFFLLSVSPDWTAHWGSQECFFQVNTRQTRQSTSDRQLSLLTPSLCLHLTHIYKLCQLPDVCAYVSVWVWVCTHVCFPHLGMFEFVHPAVGACMQSIVKVRNKLGINYLVVINKSVIYKKIT